MNKRKLPPLNGCGKQFNSTRFDDDIYRNDRLLQFNLPEIKKRRHYTFLKQKASSEKIKLCRKVPSIDINEDAIPFVQSIYVEKIQNLTKQTPIPRMLKKTENKIIKFVPSKVRVTKKSPTIITNYMLDVHKEFIDILRKYSLKNILVSFHDDKDNDNNENNSLSKSFYKHFGRTKNYQTFLKRQKNLQKNLLIPYPFIRYIFYYSAMDFPEILNNYGSYKCNDKGEQISFGIIDFAKLVKKDLEDNQIFLKKIWYPKVVKLLKKYYKRNVIPKIMWAKAIRCTIGLMNRQINELKIRTFNHLYDVISDRLRMPYFKIKILYSQNNVELYPSFEDIYKIFSKIFDDIAAVGQNLEILEPNIDAQLFVAGQSKDLYIKIEIGMVYMKDAKTKLRQTLCMAYEPILNYLKDFQEKYSGLYSLATKRDINEYFLEQHTFDEYLEKIKVFDEYLNSLARGVANEYFDIVTINQSEVIKDLRKIAEQYRGQITDKVLLEHRKESLDIRTMFQGIKNRAVEVPTSTEMLLANGEYMLDIKTKQMIHIQERIQKSLRIVGLLVDLTELPQSDTALQIELITWYNNMKDIFDQNAALFEGYKVQFEENLQVVTKKLNEDIEQLIPNISVINNMYQTEKLDEYHAILMKFIDRLKCFDDYVQWINKEEKLFKFPVSQYAILEEIKNFVIPFASLLKLCKLWLRYYYVWMDGPFENLEPEFVENTVDKFYKDFLSTQKNYRNRIKQDMIGNPVCKFKGQTEDPDEDKHPVPLRLCSRMIAWIKDFRLGAQVVSIMCNSSLRDRHWDDMSEVAGFDIMPDAGTTLRKILNFDISEKLESFEIISIGANKELQLQKNLAAMINEWNDVKFPTGLYKETGITILLNLEEIEALLDDHIIKTLTMRGSVFVKPCVEKVKEWYDKIVRVSRTLEEWQKVQINWLYLLPIFSSKDIIAQMPEESRLFIQVDQTYRTYMSMILREPTVIETAPADGLLEGLEMANEMLETITDGVNRYLENIRLYFNRFFFLSNDEMLEILSETKDPLRVQPHLNKCFEGIWRLEFDQNLDILSMSSAEREKLSFNSKVVTTAAKGRVEKWLLQVEEQMILAVKMEIEASYTNYTNEMRKEWVLKWPQMIILCISQVFWTSECHSCLRTNSQNLLKGFHQTLTSNLNDIVAVIRSKDISNLNRITIKSLIVIDVHAKDVVEKFITDNVVTETDFQWLAQLRYYWSKGKILVRVINATVPFANEYLGNSDRLVITPLTDRCYRTLICAYQLHLNGAPEGPAGTGKTETTKDLAKALAVQCKVFNCSDGLDYKAMGKFFKGLATSGAWACFDEFNRIELEVLSVVAQQILCIIVAIRSSVNKFIFEGTELILNPACYVCITMNPGYAGRFELPDNLKVLFRTVAMMIPDYAMIGEITLYSYGFVNARTLSVKIVTTYRLCSEQLSSQNHYDYGMRAVKTVLSACGNIKRALPDENEDILLLRSLLDVNLPKFLAIDIPLFEGIISDLFPGIKSMETDYSLMKKEFLSVCEELNLQPEDCFFTKIVQTFEMMIVRHGFMMVGDPFSGKSTTLKVLGIILGRLKVIGGNPYYQECEAEVVNPKSVTMSQLYGYIDQISNEWTDGIASSIFKRFAVDTSHHRKFLIFDGPIDAVWIENMNTVLDDNKKLCLTSGEVISMTGEMSMIFEVMDLAQASPATVSRCGMIYMESKTLGWKIFAKSWITQCNPLWMNDWTDFVWELLIWLIPQSLLFVRKNCVQLLKPGEINIVMTTLSIFEMLINDAVEDHPDDFGKYLTTWFQAAIIYSVIWGIGGLLDSESRDRFDGFYKTIWTFPDDNPPPASIKSKLDISIPSEGFLAEYLYIFKQKGAWKYWPDLIRRQEPEASTQGLQVATVDTGRYINLLELHIKHKRKLLLVGPTGTGKSFYIENTLINKTDPNLYQPSFIKFTVTISSQQTQNLFISKLTKFKHSTYGPPKGKTAIIFVDDFNLPAKEQYGAQPPIELLRQYFDYHYVYNLANTTKMFIKDVLFIAACGLPGGSRQDVYQRFLCHFNCFSINNFSEETMFRIFNSVLLNGFRKSGHASDVIFHVNQIVNATLHVYNSVCEVLRATPTKSHYIFNLRDVSKICLGCSLLRKDSVDSKQIFGKIWFHEVLREFGDRLIDNQDRLWLFDTLTECIQKYFNDKVENIFDEYVDESSGVVSYESVNRVLFGTYLDMDTEMEERRYEEIPNMETFRKIADEMLQEYNAVNKTKVDIVLFSYALEHLNKICRIMSMPAGSALLVGISGAGRQSLTKLATTICQHVLFQPEITKNYRLSEWRDDIKRILKETGGLGKNCVFLLTENQIKMEEFLMDVDSLLNIGEVPNIWAIDERQEILEMCRSAAAGGNKHADISALQVFAYFVKRCKEKLHLVLCFSPIGSTLRTRIRLYPSLVNCCTIDWYENWPKEALEMVAHKHIKDLNLTDNIKESLVTVCQHFHTTATKFSEDFFTYTGRMTYVTSASYLDLIQCYRTLINRKQTELMDSKMKYVCGLDTLIRASESVGEMQIELNDMEPKLSVMAENSKKMAAEIEANTIEAQIATEQVKRDEVIANKQAEEAAEMEEECSKDLAQAVPMLEEALQALNTLKPTDITLVKSMKNPPNAVKLVMAAVCVMKGVAPDRVNDPASGKKRMDYWGPSKRILGDMTFLQSLKEYDKDNINPEIMKKIRKDFIPNKDFQPHIVAKASSAAEGLCKWIIAIDMYDEVAKAVAPKQARLYAAKEILKETKKFLAEKRILAEQLEAKVMLLNEALVNANIVKKQTEDEVDLCRNKLRRATTLINSLGGERTRWTTAAENLQECYDRLPGNVLISCGIMAYLAPFTMTHRLKCVTEWHERCLELELPCSKEYSLVGALGSEIKIQNWHLYGLPQDNFSIDNSIIMDNSNRYSLFIDPQKQANKWIKSMEKVNRLKLLRFSQSNYMKSLETCIEFGTPTLIENIYEDLEAPLDPILKRHTFRQAGIEYISLGTNVIPISPNFRLYLTSNLRNPNYMPEVFNKITIIYFGLTEQGLEDQLLGIVVAKERPNLQELREQLITESASNANQLSQVEDNILQTLSNTKGDILVDESAVQILDNSKILSTGIIEKQAIAEVTKEKIEIFRQKYKTVAHHSSVLYYCIIDLPEIDPMYQFSLSWYINLYMYSIENANKSKDFERRLKFLIDGITRNLYNSICRSLFEKDKLLFSFILATNIMLSKNLLNPLEYKFLLFHGEFNKSTDEMPESSWLTEKMWSEICQLQQLDAFTNYPTNFSENLNEWQQYYDHLEPHTIAMPNDWETQLTLFEKLLIIRAIRPDKLAAIIKKFIENEMGSIFVQPPQFDISKSFEDSNCLTPLVFILSPDSDPMAALHTFAEKIGFDKQFESISLGQGQGPIAQKIVAEAQAAGSWVCLQNCHLAASWMPSLEHIWESMDIFNTSPTFRLWLTSYPSDKFPQEILQNGVKMTNEPPDGVQQSLMRLYSSEPLNDEQFYKGCPGNDKAFTRLLYGISFFHAIIQERKKCGPLGWNIPYGFNESDFRISVEQLKMLLNEQDTIPYIAVRYLTGECNYGGRVTDSWDRRAITTILLDYINENVVDDLAYRFAPQSCYILPRNTEHREIIKYISKSIPNMPEPTVYGLHFNAGITKDLQISNLIIDSMLLVQGNVSAQSNDGTEKLLLDFIDRVKRTLPENFDIEFYQTKYPFDYNESMNTVLVQEMQRFNRLLSIIRKTVYDMEDAIKGIIVMTPEIEDVCTSIALRRIPKVWMQISYPSLKPIGSYIKNFLKRLAWLQNWSDLGKLSTFWLSGFYFTQAFLTGAMQNYARKYNIPIDTLTFDFEVLDVEELTEPPNDGVYVNGLFLEGGRWNWINGIIEEQLPKILISKVPAIHLKPKLVKELEIGNRYECPLYKTAERKGILSTTGHSTNYVLPILLKTNQCPTHWIKRSVALICETSE